MRKVVYLITITYGIRLQFNYMATIRVVAGKQSGFYTYLNFVHIIGGNKLLLLL